jgi:hypothetical protein
MTTAMYAPNTSSIGTASPQQSPYGIGSQQQPIQQQIAQQQIAQAQLQQHIQHQIQQHQIQQAQLQQALAQQQQAAGQHQQVAPYGFGTDLMRMFAPAGTAALTGLFGDQRVGNQVGSQLGEILARIVPFAAQPGTGAPSQNMQTMAALQQIQGQPQPYGILSDIANAIAPIVSSILQNSQQMQQQPQVSAFGQQSPYGQSSPYAQYSPYGSY